MSFIVAPNLLAHPAACAAQPALARLAAYARPPTCEADGLAMLAAELLAGLGARPIAAFTALGAGLDPGTDYWLLADPVTLVAGASDVSLAGRVDDLAPADAEELLVALNAHFHDDGVAFVAPRPRLWLAHLADAPALVTRTLDRARALPLASALPTGDAAGQWRRWQDEVQMLLHGHPVNLARESDGLAPANAVWMWGGGRLADAGPLARMDAEAPDSALGDLVRGIASASREQAGDAPARPVRVADRIDGDAAVAAFVADVLAPALDALDRAHTRELTLVADGGGVAAAWTARTPGRWRRMRARWRTPAFVPPVATDLDA